MNKVMLRALALVLPVIGVLLLLAAVGSTSEARWGGYLEALPLVGLLVLYGTGHFLVYSLLPRRKAVR